MAGDVVVLERRDRQEDGVKDASDGCESAVTAVGQSGHLYR